MENSRGRVIAVERVGTSPHALVEVVVSTNCRRCREGKGCGAGVFGSNSKSRRVDALVGDGIDVQAGDDVRIELAPASLLQASLVVYGLPLGGAILGAVVAYLAGFGELHAAMVALGGIVAGFLVAHNRLRGASCLRQFTPIIVERLPVDEPPISQQLAGH